MQGFLGFMPRVSKSVIRPAKDFSLEGQGIVGRRILTESSNRLFQRVVRKELFPAEGKETHAQGTVRQDLENFPEEGKQVKK